MKPEFVVVPDLAATAAERICSLRPRAAALAGRSTPRPVYERLAQPNFPWSQTDPVFGDERYVPPACPDSNDRMAGEGLQCKVAARVHSMPGDACDAPAYEEEFRRVSAPELPVLDLTLPVLSAARAVLFPEGARPNDTRSVGSSPARTSLRLACRRRRLC